MRRIQSNLPGPGDFSPPDPPELEDRFVDDASDVLGDGASSDEIVELAWKLQDAAYECMQRNIEDGADDDQ